MKKEKVIEKNNKKVEKNTKKEVKKTKKNIFNKIGEYFKGVGKEAKRVRWTNGKDLFKYSIASITFIVFIGLYFYLIDMLVAFIRSLL